jgi:hypothetical protein
VKNNSWILIVFGLLTVVIAGFLLFRNNAMVEPVSNTSMEVTPTDSENTPTIELSDEEMLQASIKQAIVDKHDSDPEELSVTVREINGDYATGGAGPVTPGPGGGVWFAAQVDGEWELVWDGNGAIYCQDLEAYPDFPSSMIGECYDQETGQMVERE